MADNDLSQYSTEDLQRMLGEHDQAAPSDLSQYSTEDLKRMSEDYQEEGMREKAKENKGYLPQVGAFVTGLGQSIPFSKDIAAGLNVARSELGGHPAGVPSEGTLGEKFEAAKRTQEKAQKVLGEEYPWTQGAGVATGIGAQIAAPGTRALAAAERAAAELAGEAVPAAVAPIARGAVHVGSGAGVGAAYGAGEGVTPEERAQNALIGAGVGAAGSALAPVAGVIGRPIGKRLGIIKPTPGVMSKDELFDAARNAYRESENQGVMIKPEAIKNTYEDLVSSLTDVGYHKKNQPEINTALDELYKLTMPTMQGQPNYTTLKGIDIINQMARKASSSPDRQTRMMGAIFHDKVDDLLEKLGPGSVISGDAEAATKSLQEAKQLWKTARKTEKVEDMIDNAVLETASTGSGGNINNKLRQAITKIIKEHKKRPGGWTPDELAAMRAIVEPSAGRDLARLVGKISPAGNGLHAILELGAVSHNPKFLPLIAGGHLAKTYADKATAAAVDDLLELIRVGGRRAKMPKANPTGGVKAKNIGIGATMAGIEPFEREERKAGGRVYPAKRLTLMEKAARKAFNDIANESKPLMDMPDEQIVNALRIAKDR